MNKIAVYAIAKNEEKHVQRWYDSVKDADAIFVLDTGSDDSTVELFNSLPVNIYTAGLHPFRFDLARNFVLNQISEEYDWCLFLDLDEVMEDGWYDKLLECIETYPHATSFNLNFVFSRTEIGEPLVCYNRQMAHKNKSYVWYYPVHEVLMPADSEENVCIDLDIKAYHLPDKSKDRSTYLPLLEIGVKENPDCPRSNQYLGREYMYEGQFQKAINTLTRHLQLENSAVFRSESSRYIADCFAGLQHLDAAETWHLKAIAEAPAHRDPWGYCAMFYSQCGEYESCLGVVSGMLRVQSKPYDLAIYREDFYGAWPYHMAATCYHNLGADKLAQKHILEAFNLTPTEPRVLADYVNIMKCLPPNLNFQDIDHATDKHKSKG